MNNPQLSRTDDCANRLMELYGGMVFRIGILYLRNKHDAEDVFQEVFIKLFNNTTAKFESESQLKAYIATITVNQCKNLLRTVWQRRTVGLDELCATVRDDYSEVESDLARQVLALPIKYRRVIFLYYYEGYTTEEISEILHINPATVRTHLRRGRELLKPMLEGDDF